MKIICASKQCDVDIRAEFDQKDFYVKNENCERENYRMAFIPE